MGGELAARTATTTATKKKKKKGRPSLLDIKKRSLKQQQLHHQSPNFVKSYRRSTRQNPNFVYNNVIDDGEDEAENDVDENDERKQKKHKLLLGLDNSPSSKYHQQQQHHQFSSPNFSGLNSVFNGSDALKRRQIHAGLDQMERKVSKATDTLHGLSVGSGSTTPLPDKKLLEFVLDRLQEKDTYGVFSEPVDPEELPDYQEIIAHPMDFATVRKKLDRGAYNYLEEFEARSIHELAKKDFENLRQDSDDSESQHQPQPKVARRGRPPKSLKKSLETSLSDRVASEFSSNSILANGGDNAGWSSTHNFRKGPTTSVRFEPADALNRASHIGETYTRGLSEWENDFPASVVKAVLKYGKKQFTVDESRRDTYTDSLASGHDPSVLSTFEGELKQLMVVGLNSEYGYARSLARFAADLGPVWEIASKKIEYVLPLGVKFSPGWVGENKVTEQRQQYSYTEKQKSSNSFVSGKHSSGLMSPTNSGSNSISGKRYSLQSREDMETIKEVNFQSGPNLLNSTTLGGIRATPPLHIQSRNVIHAEMNGFSSSGGFWGFNYPPHVGVGLAGAPGKSRSDNSPMPSQMFGMVANNHYTTVCSMPATDYNSNAGKLADCSSRLHSENSSVLSSGSRSHTAMDPGLVEDSSWQGLHKQEFHPFASDFNIRFLAQGSPISNLQISSPPQPDSVLQL